jgi:FixJ family two-component response regulator
LPKVPLISIVDDDAWSRSGLEDLIQSMRFEARAFSSAEEFLNADCALETDCLITDMKMPGIGGLGLLHKLRNDGIPIPTIIVSAYGAELHRTRALKDGAAAFLLKPLDSEELVDCVLQVLAAR